LSFFAVIHYAAISTKLSGARCDISFSESN